MLKTLIVDDELQARELLKLYLADEPGIEVVGECRNGREAVSYLQSASVDLLFLDIEMPGLGGFDVVAQLGVPGLPATVFITAYNEYAVKAFEVQAIDYLTKPFGRERLAQAITRVREKMAANSALLVQAQFDAALASLQSGSPTRPSPRHLLVRDGEKEIFLAVQSIEWIEAAEYYCCLHANKRRYVLRETITNLSNSLNQVDFVRVHRSAIVNVHFIREVHREGHSDGSVILRNGVEIRMSRAGKQRLLGVGKPF